MNDIQDSYSLIVILGPTASGKTSLSLEVAERFAGEIISCDSMQIYRGMDIGTAKLPPALRRGIPHHLIDIITPCEPFSVADFRAMAAEKISEIRSRHRLPLLTGGTGLYIDSLFSAYHFDAKSSSDPELRAKLKAEHAADHGQTLHQRLQKIDPETAERIHPHDAYRLIRALEVYYSSGSTMSEQRRAQPPPSPYRPLMIGLTLNREELYRRIELRVEEMISHGLVEEVAGLLQAGINRDAVAMQGLGYRQIAAYLYNECSLSDATEILKRDTRRYAKRQMTWFKRNPRIIWFNHDHYREEKELSQEVCALIASRPKEEF